MDMTKVKSCNAIGCAYNQDNACHATAITIGHGKTHPRCDTLYESSFKGGYPKVTAGVGACRVPDCKFNESLECKATDIAVGHQKNEVDCLTFRER